MFFFQGLKIIYHGSEVEILDKDGFEYPQESILTGVAAYQFLKLGRKIKRKILKCGWIFHTKNMNTENFF